MKREGWQHGAVRVSRSKVLRLAAAAAAAGAGGGEEPAAAADEAVAVAAAKPTNASRSTGKCRRARCGGCHAHPATKARDKAKGAHKLRACDVALNHRLVSWRVVDGDGGGRAVPEYRGKSASSLLAYLAGSTGNSWHEDDDDDASGAEAGLGAPDAGLSDLYDLFVGRHADADADAGGLEADPDPAARLTDLDDVGEIQATGEQGLLLDDKGDGDDEAEEEEEDDDMGFCMVGITIAVEFSDGEEDWIVVEEI